MSPGAPLCPGLPELRRFKEALHTTFRIDLGDDEHLDVDLVDVVMSEARPGWEQFSLVFRGPPAPAFWQGTYTVEHAGIGSFPLFVVAIVTDGDGQQYEAVFNRRTT